MPPVSILNNITQRNVILPNVTPSPLPRRKKKVLCWADSCLVTTGFGVVAKHILAALQATGEYEIDQLAINHPSRFYDSNKVPYQMIPARLDNPSDPYGNQMFINAVQGKDYDIVFVINDTFVTHSVSKHIPELKKVKAQAGHTVFSLVYYYPVDCRMLPDMSGMVQVADVAVAYNNFGKVETQKHFPNKPDAVIYHGVDTRAYFPLPKEERKKARASLLHVSDDNTFVWVSVNRNSLRKDLARTLLSFSEFHKQVPNSKLYLHTKLEDGTSAYILNLKVVVDELGLKLGSNVITPLNYSSAKGFPEHILNQLYNCGDGFITTNLGEGWGICAVESMACGVPVVAPNNTSHPEIFGDGRGYLYECKEKTYIDNSGLRPMGRLEDIVGEMNKCYIDWKIKGDRRTAMIRDARAFAETYSWYNVGQEWVKLFSQIKAQSPSDICANGEQV